MSEIVATVQPRDIRAVTTEIRTITRQTQQIVLTAAIEIGRRLVEAKAMVHHGEWGQYLKQEVEFSQSTAINFMRLFEEYGDQQDSLFAPKSQALENLPYTKALRLLALPAEERAEFVEGNDVESMSTRELEQALKDLEESKQREARAIQEADAAADAALKMELQMKEASGENEMLRLKAETAEDKADKASKEAAHLRDMLSKSQKDLAAALDAAKNPVIPEDQMAKIRSEAEAQAAMEATAKAQKAVEQAEKKAEQAQKEADDARAALEKAQAAQKTADANVAVFKSLFEQIQQDFNRMNGALKKVELDCPEVAGNLRNAVKAMLEKFGGEIGV